MVSINEFCDRLMAGFVDHFQARGAMRSLTQSMGSCKAIIKRCIDAEPDYVLEMGTNYGLSTLSLAYAMTVLGLPVSCITTTDIDHSLWTGKTPDIQRALLESAGIDPSEIRTLTRDFQLVDPSEMVSVGKALVFYDIHDTSTVSHMRRFIDL